MVAQQAEMEDIISSIRTTLAEETAKVGSGNADLINAAAAQDEEVLELTEAEMAPAAPATVPAAAPADDLVDINAFAGSGESKPAQNVAAIAEDLLGEPVAAAPAAPAPAPAAPAAAPGAADEFDRLLSQISDDQKKSVAVAEEQKQALLAEDDPLDGPIPVAKPAKAEVAAPAGGTVFRAEALGEANGAQVALPAEVLAMALRPMVQEWLQENLAGIVEKLVKDEISKLNQG